MAHSSVPPSTQRKPSCICHSKAPPSTNRKSSSISQSKAPSSCGQAPKGIIYISYCGFDPEANRDSQEDKDKTENGNSEIDGATKNRIYRTLAVESGSEKKSTGIYTRYPAIMPPRKTAKLSHRHARAKAVRQRSKGLLVSATVWFSRKVFNAANVCRRALSWVKRRFFRR